MVVNKIGLNELYKKYKNCVNIIRLGDAGIYHKLNTYAIGAVYKLNGGRKIEGYLEPLEYKIEVLLEVIKMIKKKNEYEKIDTRYKARVHTIVKNTMEFWIKRQGTEIRIETLGLDYKNETDLIIKVNATSIRGKQVIIDTEINESDTDVCKQLNMLYYKVLCIELAEVGYSVPLNDIVDLFEKYSFMIK